MKYLTLMSSFLVFGFAFSQRPSVSFEIEPNGSNASNPRLVEVDSAVKLMAVKNGTIKSVKWKIGGEFGKDWEFGKDKGFYIKTPSESVGLINDSILIVFKKRGPTNISITAKAEVDSLLKGKKKSELVPISIKYERKGFLLVTELAEYDELNQLFTGGDVDSYIKLVKKASKMVENDKYSKDPFAYIWLARGLYLISGENLDFTMSKYQPYKSAFNDAVSALSKALKYDNNGFLNKVPTEKLTDDKFSDLINEMQYKYYDEIVLSNLTNDTAIVKGKTKIKDYAKINTSISKYLKITKNPICVKYLQVACLFNLKDANAKVLLKEAELELTKYIAGKDSLVFTETDELFFAAGICELLKYYSSNKKATDACVLQKRAIAALPTLIENREKFEEFQEYYDEECK